MSSPADVTIKNYTKQSVTTKVTRDSWVEDDGKPIDAEVIVAGQSRVFRVVAKSGHHGELDIDLIGGDTGDKLGVFEIKSIKDPQEGEKSLSVTPMASNVDLCAMGYRKSSGDDDLRRIYLTIYQS